MEGWISLQRKMQEHWLWEENRVFSKAEAWIDLLLFVNHAPNKITIKGVIIDVERGSTCRSLETLSKKWKWSTSKVTRFLKLLKSDGMINYETKRVTTYITVCNYGSYQGLQNSNETQTKVKRNANETQTNTNNNDNNDNNISILSFDDFWDMYDRRTGSKKKCQEKYSKVSEEDRQKIKSHVPKYVSSTPDKQFRKHPLTYLNQESWNDEIIGEDKKAEHESWKERNSKPVGTVNDIF